MRQLLINIAKAVIALAAAFITRLLNEAADKEVAAVQAKGDEVVKHNSLIDSLKAQIESLELEATKKLEAYIAAHSASVAPVSALRAEAERFQNLL